MVAPDSTIGTAAWTAATRGVNYAISALGKMAESIPLLSGEHSWQHLLDARSAGGFGKKFDYVPTRATSPFGRKDIKYPSITVELMRSRIFRLNAMSVISVRMLGNWGRGD